MHLGNSGDDERMTQRGRKRNSGGIFAVSVCEEFQAFNWTEERRRWGGNTADEKRRVSSILFGEEEQRSSAWIEVPGSGFRDPPEMVRKSHYLPLPSALQKWKLDVNCGAQPLKSLAQRCANNSESDTTTTSSEKDRRWTWKRKSWRSISWKRSNGEGQRIMSWRSGRV